LAIGDIKNNCNQRSLVFPSQSVSSSLPSSRLIKSSFGSIYLLREKRTKKNVIIQKGRLPPCVPTQRSQSKPDLYLSIALRSVPDPTPHGGTPPPPPNWNGGGTNQLCQTISFCIHRVTDGNLKCLFLIVGRRDDILVSLSFVSYSRLEKKFFLLGLWGEEADELL
jgi:hypothetical protein